MGTNFEDIIRIRSEVERLQLDGWEFVLAVPFNSLLKYYLGMPGWKAKTEYVFVRLFGWMHWIYNG